MNKTQKLEDATLSNSSSPPSLRVTWDGPGKWKFRRLRERFSPEGGTGKTPNTRKLPSAKRERFRKAFSKAIAVRTRNLSRSLTRQEWQQLKSAVRKQISTRQLPLERKIQELSTRIGQVAKLVPVSISSLEDSFSMFHVQLSVLRQQAMELITESSDVKETCPHFRNRTLFTLPVTTTTLYSENVPGLKGYMTLPIDGKEQQLCCSKCLLARQDTYYTWTGDDLVFSDMTEFSALPRKAKERLSLISPLSLQSVWTQLISNKYRSTL